MTGSASFATWASATSPSTGRPARCPAARPSGSRWPTRWARAWWTRSTCSTSRRSASTRGIPTGCWPCSGGSATRGTPSSSWSTTSQPCSRPTSCSSSAPARAIAAGGWCTPDRSDRATETLTGQYLTGQKRIAVPSLRRPTGPIWLRVRGAKLHNLQRRGRGHSARHPHRGDRRERLRQEHAAVRRGLPQAGAPPPRGTFGQVAPGRGGRHRRVAHRVGAAQGRSADRPVADRPLAALEPDHLHQGVRRDPGALRGPAAGAAAEVQRGDLLVQPAGRSVRGMRGGGARAGRDGLPGRRLRRPARRAAAPAIGARCSTSGSRVTPSTTCCSGRWTRRSRGSAISPGWAPRSGSCSRSASATSAWDSRPPRCPAARPSGSRSPAS